MYKSVYSLTHDEFNPVTEQDYKDAVTASETLKIGSEELEDGESVIVVFLDKTQLCTVTNKGRSLHYRYNRQPDNVEGGRWQNVEDIEDLDVFIDTIEKIDNIN
jgi:ribosomal protein L24E